MRDALPEYASSPAIGERPNSCWDILAEFGITIVPTSRRRRPGETHAKGALREILREHGADHLWQVLRLIRGSEPNLEALWSEVFLTVSDCLVTEPGWLAREDELRAALDRIDLGRGREKAAGLRPWPVRATLRVWLWKRLDEALTSVGDTGPPLRAVDVAP